MSAPTMIKEFHAWLLSLPAEFVFLLALPFLVVLAGLLRMRFFGQGRDRTIPGKESGDG